MTRHLWRACGALILAATVTVPAVAQYGGSGTQDNTAYGGSAGEFLLLGAGARGQALGGAYAALHCRYAMVLYSPQRRGERRGPLLFILLVLCVLCVSAVNYYLGALGVLVASSYEHF